MNLLELNSIQVRLIIESKMNAFHWISKYSERFKILTQGGIYDIQEIKGLLYEH